MGPAICNWSSATWWIVDGTPGDCLPAPTVHDSDMDTISSWTLEAPIHMDGNGLGHPCCRLDSGHFCTYLSSWRPDFCCESEEVHAALTPVGTLHWRTGNAPFPLSRLSGQTCATLSIPTIHQEEGHEVNLCKWTHPMDPIQPISHGTTHQNQRDLAQAEGTQD